MVTLYLLYYTLHSVSDPGFDLSLVKPKSDDKEQAVDKEGSDTESAEDSNSATKVTANGVEQNGNTPKVRFATKSESAENVSFEELTDLRCIQCPRVDA